MAITVIYHIETGELQLDCPSYRCAARTQLIHNLQSKKIRFTNAGSILWIERRAFKSIDDIAEKAFTGFHERKYRYPDISSAANDALEFEYAPIFRPQYNDKGLRLLKPSPVKPLRVSSKDMLEELYTTRPATLYCR